MKLPKNKHWSGHRGVRFTAKTLYVDVDTGETITQKTAKDKEKYIIIKTTKNGTQYNESRTRAIVNYTIECRKQPQQKLKFS